MHRPVKLGWKGSMTTEKPIDPRGIVETWGEELNAQAIMFHHAVGERMGLSATEYKAADILRRFGPMTAGELAKRTGLTTGAVTGLVDRLERDGFVRREHDKNDRRRVIIKPITKGKFEDVENLFGPLDKAFGKLIEDYNDHDAAVIADFVSKAAKVSKEHTDNLRGDVRRTHRGE
jgi:DNA-binding MarR family transcriptional regulator